MENHKKTKLVILVLLLLVFFDSLGQALGVPTDSLVASKPPIEERIPLRSSSLNYDEETNTLKKANDTLNIYVEDQKKVEIVSINIKSYQDFQGYELDISDFLDLIDQLNLDFKEKSYKIRFNPVDKELSIEENSKVQLKRFEEGVFPVSRHEVTFTYSQQMMEVSMFLGEWDELLVLRDANFSAMIQKEAEQNDWFRRYKNAFFNKDIRIDEKGFVKVVTYTEEERAHSFSVGFDVGIKYFAGEFPFNQQVSLVYKPRQIIKSGPVNYGFMLSLDWNQFFSRNEENKYQISEARFVNMGAVFGQNGKSFRAYYGRLISSSGQDFFQFNRDKFGFDLLVTSGLRINYEFFFGSKESDSINSIGISFPIVSGFDKEK